MSLVSSASSLAELVKKPTHENTVSMLSTAPMRAECLWNDSARRGACGGSVVASEVDRVHRSGVDMTRAVAEGWSLRGGRSGSNTVDKALGPRPEGQL